MKERVVHWGRHKSHILPKNALALGAWRKWNLHKKYEMYMLDAKNVALAPNATYIPLATFRFRVGKNAKNLRHLTQNITTCWYPCVRWRRSTIFCVRWRKSTRRQIFCVLVEYRLKSSIDVVANFPLKLVTSGNREVSGTWYPCSGESSQLGCLSWWVIALTVTNLQQPSCDDSAFSDLVNFDSIISLFRKSDNASLSRYSRKIQTIIIMTEFLLPIN